MERIRINRFIGFLQALPEMWKLALPWKLPLQRKVSSSWFLLSLMATLSILAVSCTREELVSLEKQIRKEYRIAVVLPFGDGMESRWRKSVDWALETLNAPLIARSGIRVSAEWYDEEQHDATTLFTELAARKDIQAIIGPLYSTDAMTAAECCAATDKPLFPALASSELMMRTFAKKGFLWCLTENDISQCEVLLARALQKGAKSVSLLTCDNIYGQTFTDWFAFQAKELKLEVHSVEIYNEGNIREKMQPLLTADTDCLICISSGNDATRQMNELHRNRAAVSHPFLLFSDGAFLMQPDRTYEGMEGIVQIQDPQSGFHIAYETRYGEAPEYGSAHFYDAVLLAGLGILKADMAGSTDINATIRQIIGGEGEEINGCSDENVSRIVSQLLEGLSPHVTGASGKLRFDSKLYTNVLHSVYCHWQVYQGKHLVLEYNTSDDSNRTASSVANWNWRVTQMQEFSQVQQLRYPEKEGLHALIISTSSGWENYRHQADACAMYRLLRRNGVDDDHILFVAEDDIAFHANNPYPGQLRISEDGENVYQGVRVDYRTSEIGLNGLFDLLAGEKDERLSIGSTDNLLVYWVGHGNPEGPEWLGETLAPSRIGTFFRQLAEMRCFRKSLFVMEACYAGKVGEACRDIPGLLGIMAANGNETSKVNSYSYLLRTWLSNSFTDALLEEFALRYDNSLYELYGNVYNKTMGSHVSVYNAECFDNLYTSGFREFLYP